MKHGYRRPPASSVQLVAEGTRVVVLKGGVPPYVAGVISRLRPESNLKAYVVTLDDGAVVFASAYDLAREGDTGATPLGARRED